jgi:hypothetical protein
MVVWEVTWRGQVVGVIENPKVDNFEIYGKWCPNINADLFHNSLEEGDETVVRLETTPAFEGMAVLVDDELSVRIVPQSGATTLS